MSMALQVKWDVFLSFRGEDTRRNFTSHLHDALCRRQTIKTFIDTQLPKGEEIPSTLLDTIKASKISVVIFSANYAESRWCLQELEAILDCRKTIKQIVIPVFYHVDPSHVRNQNEEFGAGFAKLQDRFKEKSDQLKRWKDALSDTANLAGHVVDDKRSEGELIKDIVDDISSRIEIVGHPALLPGIEFSAPKDFELFHSPKVAFDQIIGALRNDETSLVGLYGMGGSGKTTLAKKVGIEVKEKGIFDEVLIVVVSQAPNFKDIQRKLAVELGFRLKEEDDEEHRAKQLYLRFTKTNAEAKKKTLVILDDIWRKFDLKSKIGFPFGEDDKHCKILLTTRRQQLCTFIGCQQEISLNLLNKDEGLTLLKRHAGIDDGSFTSELKPLVIEVAKECKGLPLAIVTIGSALKGKGVDEWKLVSQKLRKSKLVDVYDVIDVDQDVYACLKLSYDYLVNEETKVCFLLCSLFPEDYEISVEELIVYGVGLDLFSDANLIEDARRELRVILKSLKASCLLLDANQERVKMHDMVRDVALWIASKEKHVFMAMSGMGLTEWLNVKGWEQYTAISLRSNEIKKLPLGLVCPKLEILFLGGTYYKNRLEVSDKCFKEMKALKVLSLQYVDLSLKSLEFLMNLKTLKLIKCTLRDISYLEKLNKLEILYLRASSLDELPRELGKLRNLRLLDFDNYSALVRIPSNLIRMCSQLEELYIWNRFKLWEVEEKSAEISNANLFELNSLSRLVSLRLNIDAKSLPKGFAFPRWQRYGIRVNKFHDYYGLRRHGIWATGFNDYEISYNRTLAISNIEVTSLIAFKAMHESVEYLCLEKTTGFQNILPNINHDGFNELKCLHLKGCSDLTCIINTSPQDVPANAFTDLVELSLDDLSLLRDICYGRRIPRGFLEKLETINVTSCPGICSLFPTELLLRLYNLKEVKIASCETLQELFQFRTEGLSYTMLLPSMTSIKLKCLPKLEYIWKGPTHYVNLQNLKSLYIGSCEILEYVFPISIARGLEQLELLTIEDAHKLKDVFFMDHESEENARDGIVVELPKLRKLKLDGLASLANFLPKNYRSTWPALEVLQISKCSNLTSSFISQVSMQDQVVFPNLEYLKLDQINSELIWDNQLPTISFSYQNLTTLSLMNCWRLKYAFPSSLVESFQQLSELEIISCFVLKTIVGTEDGALEADPTFVFPRVTSLTLSQLPYLETFYPGEHSSKWPMLKHLKISYCDKLKSFNSEWPPSLFSVNKDIGTQNACGLRQKEEEISSSNQLRQLSNPFSLDVNLQSLTSLYIDSCERLEYMFTISIAAKGLGQLEELIIENADELKQAFFMDDGNEESVAEKAGKDTMLPKVRELRLCSLASFTSVVPENYHLTWAAFNVITISKCSSLKSLIHEVEIQEKSKDVGTHNTCSFRGEEISSSSKQLNHFQMIGDQLDDELDDGLNDKLDDDETYTKLILEDLPRLRYVWNGIHDVNLQSLISLCIHSCERLEYIFPISIAKGLGKLEQLFVKNADQLKQVFFIDNGSEEIAERDGKDIVLPKLKELILDKLVSLTSVLPESYRSTWLTLEVLKISECPNLTTFFTLEVNMQGQKLGVSSLRNLIEVHINKCHRIRNLFSSTLAHYLLKLEKLTIEECDELEQIIFKDDEDGVHGKEIVLLPKLKHLSLKALPKLTRFCLAGFILKLETLRMEGFQDHQMLFPILTCLRDVKELCIKDCGGEELEGLFKPSAHVLNLQNLTTPKVSKCHKLKHLFSSTLAQTLLQNLETLIVEGFEDEHIWVGIMSCLRDVKVKELDIRNCGVKELKGLSKSSTHILTLQNLTTLSLWNCRKLRHIVVPNVLQLRKLQIQNCKELEEINIVKDEDEDEENDVQPRLIHKDKDRPADDVRSYHKQLVLHQLQCLWLEYIPSLAKFCPVNYHLIFPSLDRLVVYGCRKIETRFWYSNRGENGKGSVLAEGKPPKDDEHPQQGDIFCYCSKDMERKLPLYMKKNEDQRINKQKE